MKHPTTCKVCHKPIILELADDYMGDPHKLIPMATCDRCYDLRDRRIRIEEAIRRACISILPQMKPTAAHTNEVKLILEKSLERYNRVHADLHGMSGGIGTDDALDLLMSRPDKWGDILSTFRKTWKQAAQPPAELATP